ncbi:MAG TPA: HD domain-containing protein [Nitrolancea sp.]|jgi:putative hydrolase of HD superfamily|nr:HD domain-containing protein [Nitrolancea sp.]
MVDPSEALINLLRLAGRLKRLPRQGWLLLGVDSPESVADHSYRVALMTLLMAQDNPEVRMERALVLALCHDLPEALAGDATPFDEPLRDGEVDATQLFLSRPAYSAAADRAKRHAEEQALDEMTTELPQTLRQFIVDAWNEYEAGVTSEAQLVRQIDKLEAWLQANEYRDELPELQIESFRLGALDRVRDANLLRLVHAIDPSSAPD